MDFYGLRSEVNVLKILIRRGVKLDVLNEDGESALHISVKYMFTECVQLLIQSGCNVNIRVLIISV